MSFLLGDSTPSSLEINFIEFLRDAIDFCVRALLADQRIAFGREQIASTQRSANGTMERLQKLETLVSSALAETPSEPLDPHSTRCRANIVKAASELVHTEVASVQSTVSVDVAKLDTQASSERAECVKALEALLVKHDLPETTLGMQLRVMTGTRYTARLLATTAFGLESVIDLEIPPDHLFAHVIRVDRLMPHLEVQVPEHAVRSPTDVRLRPQRLERYHLVELALGATGSMIKLRAAPDGTGGGLDVLLHTEPLQARVVRVGDRGEPPSPPFEASREDAGRLRDFYNFLAPAAELKKRRRTLVEAKLDQQPLKDFERPSIFVERLIESMAPIVQEIAAHSLAPDELVLRRLLGEDRREEIFVTKSELRRKLEPLSVAQRMLFEPLGLGNGAVQRMPSAPPRTGMAGIVKGTIE